MSRLPAPLVAAYLRRLGLEAPPAPSRRVLDQLVMRHLHAVPFENLDVQSGRPIMLDTVALVEKVALRRRGGFCFEVNEAFRALLDALGFHVRRIEGQVWQEPAGRFGAPFDHLALLVTIDGVEWLVDVGFGDNNRAPMAMPESTHTDLSGNYRLRPSGDGGYMLERTGGGAVRVLYRFTAEARELRDYEEMCRYHQTSPDSIFTTGMICTIATSGGRITLSSSRLIAFESGVRREQPVADAAERTALLAMHFGITDSDHFTASLNR